MKLKLILLLPALIFVFSGCSRPSRTDSALSVHEPAFFATPAPALSPVIAPPESRQVVWMGEAADMDFGASVYMSPSMSMPDGHTVPSHRGLMFIRTAHISLTTQFFDETIFNVRNLVNMHGGFFESSNMFSGHTSSRGTFKTFDATIRVPAYQYDRMRQAIESLGRHIYTHESTREVSGEYHDITTRISTRRAEESRLIALIEQATELWQLIALEERLGQVRTDIEILESRRTRIDSLASFSTIHLRISEATTDDEPDDEDQSFFDRIRDGFSSSISGTLAVLQGIILFFVYISIPATIIGILVVVAVIILRKHKNNSKIQ